MSCAYESSCLNNSNCYRCTNQNLLKIKGQKGQQKTAGLISQIDNKTAMADDSWKDLEQQVANKLNNIPTIEQARRSRMSGALPFETGDVVDSILHPECKERKGSELKSGEKSISIKKEWLEKAAEECRFKTQTMCLPFRFKGDSAIYCIFNNDDIADLITTMKAYILDNELKDNEINRLKKRLEELQNGK